MLENTHKTMCRLSGNVTCKIESKVGFDLECVLKKESCLLGNTKWESGQARPGINSFKTTCCLQGYVECEMKMRSGSV